VGISDLKVSDDPGAALITHALGSCLAVIVHDRVRKMGGMIHFMLPAASTAPKKAEATPAMFADTGVPLLFRQMYELGSDKESLVVKVAGGARLYNVGGMFDIGRRNYTMLRKIFWKNAITIAAEDVGGNRSRTVSLLVDSGRVLVRSYGEKSTL